TRENAAWYAALVAIDRRGDKGPLIELLQSGPPPASIAFYIGDLLDRYTLKRPNKRPRRPAYSRTQEQIELIAALINVDHDISEDRLQAAEALKLVAQEGGLDEEKLAAAYQGKHGGLRRAMRHWYPPKK